MALSEFSPEALAAQNEARSLVVGLKKAYTDRPEYEGNKRENGTWVQATGRGNGVQQQF